MLVMKRTVSQPKATKTTHHKLNTLPSIHLGGHLHLFCVTCLSLLLPVILIKLSFLIIIKRDVSAGSKDTVNLVGRMIWILAVFLLDEVLHRDLDGDTDG